MRPLIVLAMCGFLGLTAFSTNGYASTCDLFPNQDLTPLNWFVWPGDAPNHWSLIDDVGPLDGNFVHSNVLFLEDRYGFTNPSGSGTVNQITFSMWVDIELRGQPVAWMELRYYINGNEKGSTSFQATYDGLTQWSIAFPENTSLSSLSSLEVKIKDLFGESAIHLQNLVATAQFQSGGSKIDPNDP